MMLSVLDDNDFDHDPVPRYFICVGVKCTALGMLCIEHHHVRMRRVPDITATTMTRCYCCVAITSTDPPVLPALVRLDCFRQIAL